MKYELRLPFYLAWQYIRRGKKWTIGLTVLMLAVAFINLLFISSLFNGIVDGANKQIINTITGNITLVPNDGQEYINNVTDLSKKIAGVEGVVGVSPQLQVNGRLNYNNITGNWETIAVYPIQSNSVLNISEKLIEGSYLQEGDTDQIIIGKQIAGGDDSVSNAFSFKGAKVGDKLLLVTASGTKELTIKGIFETKFINADQRAFITIDTLKSENPELTDKASSILLKNNPSYSEDEIARSIKSLDIDAKVYTWQEVSGYMKSISESFLSINVIVSFVGVLIAAITIFIIIYVDILNKRRQIGILRAIGIRPYIIIFSYVILSAVYACLGVGLGMLIFYAGLVPYFDAHPFSLPITDAVLLVEYPDLIARTETIIWVSILSGLIPAIMVTKSKMLDAIVGK